MFASSLAITNISFDDLVSGRDVSASIEAAFGLSGLGILTVSGVEGYVEARERLLNLAPTLAALPSQVKASCEDPESNYSVGWSHGQESLSSGVRDTFKGSFYANPLMDAVVSPAQTPSSIAQLNLTHCRPNIWPSQHLPELEPAFKELGKLMTSVGFTILQHCDRYLECHLSHWPKGRLFKSVESCHNLKGRLLHYFPPAASQEAIEVARGGDESVHSCQSTVVNHKEAWCGWHTDHGTLTGLTSALYTKDGREVPAPDSDAGLYIRDRSGAIVKAKIPQDCIAFQVGETMQIHSGGLLHATPHYVRAAAQSRSQGVSRNAFAVFMQPDMLEPLDVPEGMSQESLTVGQWKPGMTFGEFAEVTIKTYYECSPLKS
ncbi:hypothetical protein CEUSTIGMA_g11333.t1 [Chlamydomonas eustigma]|uniref:Uncharacterized protein n=1 Tax=Chlamydomonas eustigma TaxID=1157962 RepID=A0A250XLV3_9CHLO|nr:hypothetical protein CEUSTIGMA_g11333.t1 [Chlamydomonas eustigma]|eukprot:GAX83909.1 hypothetical protein CEUSTIGMA_g11333.t1 [Chlamydomonas eustigma]